MVEDNAKKDILEVIFGEIGGFGRFQILAFLLICISNTLAAAFVLNYVFTTGAIDYRWVNVRMRKYPFLPVEKFHFRQFIKF